MRGSLKEAHHVATVRMATIQKQMEDFGLYLGGNDSTGILPGGPYVLIRELSSTAADESSTAGPIVAKAIGPHDVPIRATLYGVVIFEFSRSRRYKLKKAAADSFPTDKNYFHRLQYMNSFLMTYLSALNILMNIGFPTQNPISSQNFLLCYKICDGWQINKQPRFSKHRNRVNLSPEVIIKSVDLMNAAYETLSDDSFMIMSILYIAQRRYSENDFSSALILSWTIVEVVLNKMWVLYIEKNVRNEKNTAGSFGEKRKKFLTSLNSTATVSQMMAFCDLIEEDILDSIDRSRVARNSFVHKLKSINEEDAAMTIKLATDLLSRAIGQPLYCSLMRHFIGGLA